MHHSTLKAAVTRYLLLIAEGKTEAEIKSAIAADEKGFKPEEVEEIYKALLTAGDEPDSSTGGKVVVNFGVHIPEHGQAYTKEEIEANQDIIDYLLEIGSGAVSIIKEGK
jgi:hypothetical protein